MMGRIRDQRNILAWPVISLWGNGRHLHFERPFCAILASKNST